MKTVLDSTTTRSFRGALVALLLLSGVHRGIGSPQVRANTNDNTGGSTPAQTASSGSVADQESGTTSAGSSEGRASASFGVLRAYGFSQAGGLDNSGYSIFSINQASWRDDFRFDAPGLTGTAGTVTVRFTIDGSISASRNGVSQQFFEDPSYARVDYTFGVDPGSGPTKQERVYADGRRDGTAFLGIPQEFTLNFTYGMALADVTLRITAATETFGERFYYSSSAIADMENTATWGGFAAVRDAGGNLVTDYTFSSTSGANYTQAIPEPGTVLLLAAAGVVLLLRKRRRARA